MHVVDLDFVYDSQQILERLLEEPKIQDLYTPPFDDTYQPLPPPFGSRVSGESSDHAAFDLKSTLVSGEFMATYLLAKDKLRKDKRLITLEDHQWHLSLSLDHDYVGVDLSTKSWIL